MVYFFYIRFMLFLEKEAIGDIAASAEVSRAEVDGALFDIWIQRDVLVSFLFLVKGQIELIRRWDGVV